MKGGIPYDYNSVDTTLNVHASPQLVEFYHFDNIPGCVARHSNYHRRSLSPLGIELRQLSGNQSS
jgi:hypothetical protein